MFGLKRFSFLGIVFNGFRLWYQGLNSFNVVAAYSGVLTFIALIFGRMSYSCNEDVSGWWCYSGPQKETLLVAFIIAYLLLVLFTVFSFIYDFYACAFNKQKFTLRNIISPTKIKLKSIGLLLIILAVLCLSGVFAYMILNKPANADWRIEFMWFVLTFSLCMLPLLTMRLISAVGVYLESGHLPPLSVVYAKTTGHGHSPIISLLIFILLVAVIHFNISREISVYNRLYNYFPLALFLDFLANCFIFSYFSLFVSFVRAQQELLELTETPAANDEAVEQKEEPESERKNGKIKAMKPKKSNAKKSNNEKNTGGIKKKKVK
jgi:hypothetical protein